MTRGVRLVVVLALALALAACASVLGIRPTSPSHPFEHRAHVTRGVGCLECHAGVASADGKAPMHFPNAAECRRCHEKPHDERDCTTCHGEAYVRQGAELAREHLRFEHRTHAPRVRGDCVRCHVAIGAERPEALRPTMGTCFGCHAHQDQWTTRACDACHVDLPAERVVPSSHMVHDGDWLREHGLHAASARDLCATCHSERQCASCHGVTVPTLPWKLAFDEPRIEGLHRAGFRARHADEARAQSGLCATCHAETFCISCHEKSHVAPGSTSSSPHPAGWMSAARGGGDHGREARIDPVACASCHGGAGEALCVGCHRVGGPGGNPHGPGWTSKKDRTHDVPCRACHGGGP